jgi:ketosteroid isomerase-like protein
MQRLSYPPSLSFGATSVLPVNVLSTWLIRGAWQKTMGARLWPAINATVLQPNKCNVTRRGIKPTLLLLGCLLLGLPANFYGQRPRAVAPETQGTAIAESHLTGVYRLNPELSDRLYSVVSSASSNLPFSEQQRFFIDLTERLTPPDQLAIRRHGNLVEIASSRAPRTTFSADGREHVEHTPNGGLAQERATFAGESLILTSVKSNGEAYAVTFTPLAGGKRLRVLRRITFKELNQPVVIQCVYDRISDVAKWEIYGEPSRSPTADNSLVASVEKRAINNHADAEQAQTLSTELARWVEATNNKDIRRQMDFYSPMLRAYYLTRATPRDFVKAEKARVFAKATKINITVAEPELVFIEGGQSAVMRFRKRYDIEEPARSRRGEVIQELRWRKTDSGWKIYSERDIRVIR